ncbi:MAG TPA: hypothetical protein VHE34_22155 [Puia sp.]|uniref:hypothetical protein n=1 Tax=Puia sp. TaxID=2045100 RepID=UPI002CE8DB17|nr:hypothetical protein [Puia sp.]HVU97950.1 hypothetical protein [Puia sp.]
MYRILATVILAGLLTSSKAQRVIDVNSTDGAGATDYSASSAVMGQLYTGLKFVRVTAGTPFFKEQFMKAVLFDDGGGRYRCNAVRINLLDNEINFLGADGRENVATSPVRRIILTDSTNGANYYFIWGLELTPPDKSLEKVWFQVLVNDETTLCRQIKKKIHETPSYGTATTDQDILSIDAYWLHRNGKLTAVRNWDDLLNQLQDQKPMLTQYIHDHHLKGKSADDFTQVVTAYNAAKRS